MLFRILSKPLSLYLHSLGDFFPGPFSFLAQEAKWGGNAVYHSHELFSSLRALVVSCPSLLHLVGTTTVSDQDEQGHAEAQGDFGAVTLSGGLSEGNLLAIFTLHSDGLVIYPHTSFESVDYLQKFCKNIIMQEISLSI